MIPIDAIQSFCLNKEQTTEEFPFDQSTLVYKVLGKNICALSAGGMGARKSLYYLEM